MEYEQRGVRRYFCTGEELYVVTDEQVITLWTHMNQGRQEHHALDRQHQFLIWLQSPHGTGHCVLLYNTPAQLRLNRMHFVFFTLL